MTQVLPKLITFEEFIDWYPNKGILYELKDRVIIEMSPPTGDHEKVVGFIAHKLTVEFDRLNLPYTVPKTTFVKPERANSAYSPDVLLLNLDNLSNEEFWKQASTVTQAPSIPLLVEVVLKDTASHISSNWRDDYYLKS